MSRHNAQKIDFLPESRTKLIFTHYIDFGALIMVRQKKFWNFWFLVLFKYPEERQKRIFFAGTPTNFKACSFERAQKTESESSKKLGSPGVPKILGVENYKNDESSLKNDPIWPRKWTFFELLTSESNSGVLIYCIPIVLARKIKIYFFTGNDVITW